MIEELGLGRGEVGGVYIYRLVLTFFSVRVGGRAECYDEVAIKP